MAKGESPLQLSQGWRAPGRNEKAQRGKIIKSEFFKDKFLSETMEYRHVFQGIIKLLMTNDLR
jgi:hypothetical protein